MNLKSLFSRKSSFDFFGGKKQQALIGIFVVIVVITLIFLYYSFWRSPSSSIVAPPGANQNVRLERVIEKVNFDAEFLKATRFQDLKLYGEWPLEIPDKGRANPFLYGN